MVRLFDEMSGVHVYDPKPEKKALTLRFRSPTECEVVERTTWLHGPRAGESHDFVLQVYYAATEADLLDYLQAEWPDLLS